MNEVEQIKQRIDLVDLVSQYVVLKKAGANYKGVCPFHQEKTPSLMVSPEKQIWKCFGCSRGGDQFSFIMEAEHLEFADALKLLAQKAGVTLQSKTAAEHQGKDRKTQLYRLNNFTSLLFQKILLERPEAALARDYLAKRSVKTETIKQFRLGFAAKGIDSRSYMLKKGFQSSEIAAAGNPDKFFERIIFPIFDVLGNVIAFTGRTLGDSQPKYLNSPETILFNKSRTLYGLNLAKAGIKEKDFVVLVEGQMDVIMLAQIGVTNAVASSGTAITEAQLMILSKYTNNFLLAFDSDQAGQQTTVKVIEMLFRLDLNAKVADFGQYKDAGELGQKDPEQWRAVAKTAKEAVDWLIDQEKGKVDNLNFIENKKKIIRALLPILKLVDQTRLDHSVQRLSIALEVKPETIYQAVAKVTEIKTIDQGVATSQLALTGEEQLLAALLAKPALINQFSQLLDQVVWQSSDASRVAETLKKYYNDRKLTNTPSQFLSAVKTSLDSQLAQKLDLWQFWLSSQWSEFDDRTAETIIGEKFTQLSTKKYQQDKENLALKIRNAQEQGDIEAVKKLMVKLSQITKEKNG